jgi:hypothetical protein
MERKRDGKERKKETNDKRNRKLGQLIKEKRQRK